MLSTMKYSASAGLFLIVGALIVGAIGVATDHWAFGFFGVGGLDVPVGLWKVCLKGSSDCFAIDSERLEIECTSDSKRIEFW